MIQHLNALNGLPKPQQEVGREYMAILREDLTLDEKLTAIYTRAMKDISGFNPKDDPNMPEGLFAVFEEYKMAPKDEKSAAWKHITEKFYGWVKARDDVRSENLSNKTFLKEMKSHFEKIGLINYSEQIQLKLNEFSYETN